MADFHVRASIRKTAADADTVHVYGWAAMCIDDLGEPVIDSDREYIPVAELEKAVQDAFLRRGGSGAVGEMHTDFGKADLVESFVLSGEKREAFGLGDGPQGWMVGLRSNDAEIGKAVRSGELMELSIRGKGRVEPVTVPAGDTRTLLKNTKQSDDGTSQTVGVIRDLELRDVELLSFVDRGASANKRVRSRIVLIKKDKAKTMPMDNAGQTKPRSAQFILAELFEQGKLTDLPPEDKEVLLTSLGGAPATAPAPAPAPEPKPEPKADPEPAPAPKTDGDVPPKTDGEVEPKGDEEGDMSKREKDLAKQNAELTGRVAELEKAAKRGEIRDMVKRDMLHFPGSSVDEIVKVVEEGRANLAKDDADKLESMLKAASEVCKKSSLFKRSSAAGDGGGSTGNAAEQLTAIAKGLREKDSSLSQSEAIVKAGKDNPEVYSQYLEERRRPQG